MKITYDPVKNHRNIRLRDLPFDRVAEVDFTTAIRSVDIRKEYGEVRVVAMGYLEQRLHLMCYVQIAVDTIRVISFRKANNREMRKYAKSKAID